MLKPSIPEAVATLPRYVLDSEGNRVFIEVEATPIRLRGAASVVLGEFTVDLRNLTNSRGTIRVDMMSLNMHSFGLRPKDQAQTSQVRKWLGLSDEVPLGERESARFAAFAIRSIDQASATNVQKIAPTNDEGDDIRVVTLVAHGEFLLHQRRVNKDIPLEITFRYHTCAAVDAMPYAIDIEGREPFQVNLPEHGLTGAEGDSTSAEVSLSLHASPYPVLP